MNSLFDNNLRSSYNDLNNQPERSVNNVNNVNNLNTVNNLNSSMQNMHYHDTQNTFQRTSIQRTSTLLIRKATPNDTEEIARAITQAGGSFLPWLFGRNFANIVHDSTNTEDCSFSWTNAIVCQIDDRIAGVVIAYPSEKEKAMDIGLSEVLKKYFNIFSLFMFLRKARKAVKYFIKPDSSYYILAIAVFEEFRGMGIAGRLMNHVENLARSGGYTSLALEVESYNYSAIRAYQKSGFQKRFEIPITKFSRKLSRKKGSSMWLMRKKMV